MIRQSFLSIVMTALAVVGHAQDPAGARRALPGASATPIAFVDVAVVPMDADRVLPHQTVLVQRGWVTALGPVSQVSVPAGAVRIDGQGKFLMPGLADMHVHLNSNEKRRFADSVEFIQAMQRDSIEAERRLLLWLANGVTTVRNMDYLPVWVDRYPTTLSGEFLLRLRAQAAAGELLSPRIYTSAAWAPKQYVRKGSMDRGPSPRLDSVAAYIAAYKAAGYDFVKLRGESAGVFDSAVAAARRLGVPIAGHLPPSVEEKIERAIVAGYASVEHLMGYYDKSPRQAVDTPGYMAEHDSAQQALAATQRAGLWTSPTLAIYLERDPGNRGWLIQALQAAGAGLLLGTDVPVLKAPDAIHRELQALVAVGGLTPYQALVTGTRNVATFFGTLQETGTVAVGKRADLVLVGGNPLADIRHAARPAGVMLGGRWLPRAELERRLAISWPGPEEELEWQLALDWYPVHTLSFLFAELNRTEAQQSAATQRTAAYVAQRKALTDSLGPGAPTATRQRRIARLLVRQLAELRGDLTPEQQATFDGKLREWNRLWEKRGLRLDVPSARRATAGNTSP